VQYSVDHIEPYATGGRHQPENLQLLPYIDNCRKAIGRPLPPKPMRRSDFEAVELVPPRTLQGLARRLQGAAEEYRELAKARRTRALLVRLIYGSC
jgi:hypothetical protein